MARTILRRARKVYTFDVRGEVLSDVDVLIDGQRIAAIGPDIAIRDSDRVIDASRHLVIPGLVNTHHHFFQSVTRAVPTTLNSTILEWLQHSYLLWAGLDAEAVYWASQLAAAELLLSGCTTSADFAYLYPEQQASLFDEEVDAVREMGLRLHAVRGCAPVLEEPVARALKAAAVPAGLFLESEEQIFEASSVAVAKHHDPQSGAMVRVALGPTQAHYAKPEFMSALKQLANDLDVHTHLHFHPRPDERDLTQRLYDLTPHQFLDQAGWLDSRTWVAHASEHTVKDAQLLAERGTGVSHCPGCVMRLGMNITKVPQMASAGVDVSIGVDGGASNDSGAMLPELRNALMLHRPRNAHPDLTPTDWLDAEDIFRMATVGGARVLGRDDIGALAPGRMADVVLIRGDTIGLAGSFDPLSALLFTATPRSVDYTIVNGDVVVQEGRLASGREAEIVENANRVTRRLAQTATKRFGIDFGFSW